MEKWQGILIMAGTIYLLRTVPMFLIKGEIKNPYLKNFFFYVPYVTLAVMTVPAIFNTTISPYGGFVAMIVGSFAAWRGAGLLPVATLSCLSALVLEFFSF